MIKQNFNSRSSCLQGQGKESIVSGNASGKIVKEVIVDNVKKITDNVKSTSFSHSTKQGNSNSNISNRVKKMLDSMSTNNRGHEDKKNVIILGDSVIKYVIGYGIAEKLNECKVFIKRFSGAKVPTFKRSYETISIRKSGSFCFWSDRSPELSQSQMWVPV